MKVINKTMNIINKLQQITKPVDITYPLINIILEYNAGLNNTKFKPVLDLNTGILRNMTDGGNGMAGHVRSQSAIKSHKEKITGRTVPQEIKEKIAKSNTGKKRSEETKRKLSESHIGLKQSEETKKKRADKLKGIKRSKELKQQWSESKKGKNKKSRLKK